MQNREKKQIFSFVMPVVARNQRQHPITVILGLQLLCVTGVLMLIIWLISAVFEFLDAVYSRVRVLYYKMNRNKATSEVSAKTSAEKTAEASASAGNTTTSENDDDYEVSDIEMADRMRKILKDVEAEILHERATKAAASTHKTFGK